MWAEEKKKSRCCVSCALLYRSGKKREKAAGKTRENAAGTVSETRITPFSASTFPSAPGHGRRDWNGARRCACSTVCVGGERNGVPAQGARRRDDAGMGEGCSEMKARRRRKSRGGAKQYSVPFPALTAARISTRLSALTAAQFSARLVRRGFRSTSRLAFQIPEHAFPPAAAPQKNTAESVSTEAHMMSQETTMIGGTVFRMSRLVIHSLPCSRAALELAAGVRKARCTLMTTMTTAGIGLVPLLEQ
mgnify:CR=1 FL=1